MKTVYLLRHGKSDWGAAYEGDLNRPLAKRGRKAADRIGRFFAQFASPAPILISSPAIRARRTAERFREASGVDSAVRIEERLYHGDEEDLLDVIEECPTSAEAIVLVGHEPVWSEAASLLIGGGDLRFPTAALARIDLHVDAWDDADEDVGELVWFVTPRLIKPLLGVLLVLALI